MNGHGVALCDQIDLLLRQPDAVYQLRVPPQAADGVQPLHVAEPALLKQHLNLGLRFRGMDVRTHTPLLRQGIGPLGGIEAALVRASGRGGATVFLPCDLPDAAKPLGRAVHGFDPGSGAMAPEE